MQLALQAMRSEPDQTANRAAKIFNCSQRTLHHRPKNIKAKSDTPNTARLLRNTEAEVITREILRIDSSDLAPSFALVNWLAAEISPAKDERESGNRWANLFVKRQPALRAAIG